MPRNTPLTSLVAGSKGEAAKVRKDGGEQFQHVFGGLYGKKGIREFLKERSVQYRRSMESNYYFTFWCKEQDIEEEFQLVDFIGSL